MLVLLEMVSENDVKMWRSRFDQLDAVCPPNPTLTLTLTVTVTVTVTVTLLPLNFKTLTRTLFGCW